MINNIRNTVSYLINKDNRGYITPEEFNQFAKQAQLDIFEDYFSEYAKAIAKQNGDFRARTSSETFKYGTGYADIPEDIAETIEGFAVSDSLLNLNGINGKFYYPGFNPALLSEPKAYKINRITYNDTVDIERVPRTKIKYFLKAKDIAPTIDYPIYTLDQDGIKVYPTTIISSVTIDYIRYPKDPKWTYTSLAGGEPIFNQGATDYQDFELPSNDETNLIIKILQYAGLTIRELDVIEVANGKEIQDIQTK